MLIYPSGSNDTTIKKYKIKNPKSKARSINLQNVAQTISSDDIFLTDSTKSSASSSLFDEGVKIISPMRFVVA